MHDKLYLFIELDMTGYIVLLKDLFWDDRRNN